jgi:hypothetical protein
MGALMAGAVEIKDKNSNVRLTLNAQGAAFIDTITPIDIQGTVTATPTGTQTVAGTVSAIPIADTAITGFYSFDIADVAAVTGARNYLTIMNPSGSGKTLRVTAIVLSYYQVGDASTSVVAIRSYRITAASAGTLAAASEINKFSTSFANTVAEIRYGNVTATPLAAIVSTPPPIGAGKGSTPTIDGARFNPETGLIVLAQGEGMVIRCEAGDVDQRFNLGFRWAEV